jgi:hypothetical protein
VTVAERELPKFLERALRVVRVDCLYADGSRAIEGVAVICDSVKIDVEQKIYPLRKP